MLLHKFDKTTGSWIPGEEIQMVFEEEALIIIPEGYTDKQPPQPCWRPVWDKVNKEWVETATEEEKNPPVANPEPSPLEKQVQLIQKALDDLILAGGGF